jgi:hypothetical protein
MIPEKSIDNLEGSCSIQLSYGRRKGKFKVQGSKFKVQTAGHIAAAANPSAS